MSELVGVRATAALQTLVCERPTDPDRMPRQLNGCHALNTGGALVAKYYNQRYARYLSPEAQSVWVLGGAREMVNGMKPLCPTL